MIRIEYVQQQGAWQTTLPSGSARPWSAALVTGFVGSATHARARVARLVPGAGVEVLNPTSPPCVVVSLSDNWPAEPILTTIAASLDAVVVLLERLSVGASGLATAELADAATLAVRLVPPGSVVRFDELLPYRSLAGLSRPELESLVRETLGGILRQAPAERDRLIATLWARHRHDTDSGAVRALAIDPRALRRRRDRIHELTGLDPSRQSDRFRLDLGLHALRLLGSHNPGIRPNFDIATRTATASRFAPHHPRATVELAGSEERKQ